MSTELASDVIQQEVDDHGVCTVTLNRPDALNSMNGELVDHLWHAFHSMSGRDDVRVVVLTGAGEKAFCVGADLKERKGMTEAEVDQRLRDYRGTMRAIETVSKPVICAINGYAFGGGLEIALACDLRVMSSATKIGLTETRLGIIPGAGGTQRLPRIVGVAKAKELIYTARRLDADEALSIGLVNRVHPPDELLAEARALGREIARAAPIALAQAKTAIQRGVEVDLETGLELEAQCYAVTIPTDDRVEGLEAFAEKRDPEWTGR